MSYLLAGLAVYKVVQLVDQLTPREAMPWVKVVFGVVVGYAVSFTTGVPNSWISGLILATIASACHGTLRLITLLGDMAARRSNR